MFFEFIRNNTEKKIMSLDHIHVLEYHHDTDRVIITDDRGMKEVLGDKVIYEEIRDAMKKEKIVKTIKLN